MSDIDTEARPENPADSAPAAATTTGMADPGLVALVMLLRFHGIGVDPEQIRHRCGTSTIGTSEMLRCARDLGLKAGIHKTRWQRLTKLALPGIATLKDGGFLIIAKS